VRIVGSGLCCTIIRSSRRLDFNTKANAKQATTTAKKIKMNFASITIKVTAVLSHPRTRCNSAARGYFLINSSGHRLVAAATLRFLAFLETTVSAASSSQNIARTELT
jgi:hypothetical protein